MNIFGSWSVISFLRFTAQLFWAILFVLIAGQIVMLIIFYLSGGEVGLVLPVYIELPDFYSFLREAVADDSAVLTRAGNLQMTFTPLHGSLVMGSFLALFQLGLTGLALYGFTLLKKVLNEMHVTETFTRTNGSDMRKVGLLLVMAAPLKFIFEWASGAYFSAHVQSEAISATLPPIDFTLLFAGLICLVIAEILNQASIMYEEQKLTV